MTDLFDIPESLSPKEAWKRNHGVDTFSPTGKGKHAEEWQAKRTLGDAVTYGEDEECALYLMSCELGVKFYKIVT